MAKYFETNECLLSVGLILKGCANGFALVFRVARSDFNTAGIAIFGMLIIHAIGDVAFYALGNGIPVVAVGYIIVHKNFPPNLGRA